MNIPYTEIDFHADQVWTSPPTSNANVVDPPNNPQPTGYNSSRSVWWKLVSATTVGPVVVDTSGTGGAAGGDTEMAVYTGDGTYETLVRVAADSDSGGRYTSRLVMTLVAGTTYWIQVSAFNGQIMDYILSVTPPRPTTPNLTWREANFGGHWESAPVNNQTVLDPTGTPLPAAYNAGKSIWWRYIPIRSGLFAMTTALTNGDTEIAMYTGGPAFANLVKIAQDSDSGGGSGKSALSVQVTGGTAYWIQVAAYQGRVMTYIWTASGPATVPLPRGDFANAEAVVIKEGAAYVSPPVPTAILDTVPEPGSPALTDRHTHPVWWKYVPKTSGSFTVETVNSGVHHAIAVYEGTAIDALTRLVGGETAAGRFIVSRAINVEAGKTYYVRMEAFSAAPQDLAFTATGPDTDMPSDGTEPEYEWWDGSNLVPCTLDGVWDGSTIQTIELLGVWNGVSIQSPTEEM